MGRKNFSRRYGYNQTMPRWESAWLNNQTYLHYYYFLKELAINMYKWDNLPETVDERFLELTLFEDGMSVFFKDEILGELALQVMIGGELDVYRIPNVRTAYAVNGYNRRLTKYDSVIIFNNYLHTTTHLDVDMFARRLYNITRTADVNINGQKTPLLILCEESQKLTVKNMLKEYDGNEPMIFGYKDLGLGDLISAIKTDVPFVADKLNLEKNRVWNEAMLFFGINNTNMDKKERMVADEANGNMEQVMMSRNIGLNARKQACEKINKMFGLNVNVRYNEELQKLYDATFEDLQISGEGSDNVE